MHIRVYFYAYYTHFSVNVYLSGTVEENYTIQTIQPYLSSKRATLITGHGSLTLLPGICTDSWEKKLLTGQ